MCASDVLRRPVARPWGARGWLWLGLALAVALPAQAQSDREREQIRRLREQLRQQQQVQSELQAGQQAAQAAAARQKTEFDNALAAARAGQSAVARKLQALQDEANGLRADRTRLEGELQQARAEVTRVNDASRQARSVAQQAEQRVQQELTAQSLSLASCRADNATLAALGEELLSRYERKGLFDVFNENEPFVQAGRVTLENAQATYAERLARARQRPAAGAR